MLFHFPSSLSLLTPFLFFPHFVRSLLSVSFSSLKISIFPYFRYLFPSSLTSSFSSPSSSPLSNPSLSAYYKSSPLLNPALSRTSSIPPPQLPPFAILPGLHCIKKERRKERKQTNKQTSIISSVVRRSVKNHE